ncbi:MULTISPECIES: type III secretion system export apparatus subunit SctR [Paraburkholderia]|jgi:type III secretion protein R|uniref:EscR/YscR/HrcR family type III secretion system export apparatus protein n=2 Tax=Paraburkholderia TaxID=1822464 RepID=A0ABQ1NE28_9BURK|nr:MULTISPECIES: type III secretion system export apparatus subunit SctR [Paraburkholderia]KPD17836.1 type III secretion system protein SsaR [Burkholderia sp. ST111]MBK5151321.1 type III secretion system export apparatus subunit SctR [Burkholderia sp. R-69608]MCP2089995.1 type III secretion protein R [Paraburkholderia sediminicola]AXL48601.1 type III secretion system protein SsaR [Paraburkholderia caffeinilytica]MBK3742541.1 EscR/YscR/HrcR family type III secretion system export apparatus prot
MNGTPEIASLLVAALALAVLPFAAMVVTSYTKIVVVLGLLRNALGLQQVPPTSVLNGVAIMVSCFIMAPVGMEAMHRAQLSSDAGSGMQVMPLLDAAREPFRVFLKRHASEREKAFFLRSAREIWPPERAAELKQDDLIVLAPAFTLSELTAAFKMGFLLYLAFIVIDLVIANVLMALGLSQVNPTNVAIPFKLLLFVSMDGWSTLIHGLISTYR